MSILDSVLTDLAAESAELDDLVAPLDEAGWRAADAGRRAGTSPIRSPTWPGPTGPPCSPPPTTPAGTT